MGFGHVHPLFDNFDTVHVQKKDENGEPPEALPLVNTEASPLELSLGSPAWLDVSEIHLQLCAPKRLV